ncbi:MAG TPA: DUF1254 domain-containing protein [Burkholderiaceae bacterium]|nr:DUF1254 domain-containing protein [Burkholderiaceae bacterium]
MKPVRSATRLWFYRGLFLLATALIVHVLAVWALPRLIMLRLMHGPAIQELNAFQRAGFPPPVDATARRIVMPSPDLLYALCVYDLSKAPMRITAHPRVDTYWSIALYSASSDNYFVINDRQAGSKPVDLWLVPDQGNAGSPGVPPGARVVVSPSSKGLLLMRVLISDPASEGAALEAARRSLSCTPMPGAPAAGSGG